MEHGFENASEAEGVVRRPLCGGGPEHEDAARVSRLLGREEKRLELPRQDRREEAPSESNVVAEAGFAVHRPRQRHAGIVAVTDGSQSEFQQTEDQQRSEGQCGQPEQPDSPTRGGRLCRGPLALGARAGCPRHRSGRRPFASTPSPGLARFVRHGLNPVVTRFPPPAETQGSVSLFGRHGVHFDLEQQLVPADVVLNDDRRERGNPLLIAVAPDKGHPGPA